VYGQPFDPEGPEANLEVVDALKLIAERLDISLAQMALAWVPYQAGLTGAIAGSRSPRHVRENAAAAPVKLSTADLAEIQTILERRGEVVKL
jgi:aryl-alcohol dehydrogenase-like predicted oxidoreductase